MRGVFQRVNPFKRSPLGKYVANAAQDIRFGQEAHVLVPNQYAALQGVPIHLNRSNQGKFV